MASGAPAEPIGEQLPGVLESFFGSDTTVASPSPLAKRLRLDSYDDGVKKTLTEEEASGAPQTEDTGMQTPPPLQSQRWRLRISSTISTDVPITPKPSFDQMATPELKVCESILLPSWMGVVQMVLNALTHQASVHIIGGSLHPLSNVV